MTDKKRLYVFYSWQSDLPNASNRAFIRGGLRAAATSVEEEFDNRFVIEVDEATRDVSGSPNIPATILGKIEAADVFVADVTTINATSADRKTPNPNVNFELGYAVATLGWERVVLVFNTEYGAFPQDLPFDFDRHRASPFSATGPPSKKQKAPLREMLKSALTSVIRNDPDKPTNPMSSEEKMRSRDVENIRWVIGTLHLPTLDQHIDDLPDVISDRLLHFWLGFNAVMSSSLFHLYDEELRDSLSRLHAAFRGTVCHGEMYHPNADGSTYIFGAPSSPEESQDQERIRDSIMNSAQAMRKELDDVLGTIRSNYIEVSLDDTNKRAWLEFVEFKKNEVAELEGDSES